jgi:Uma2 family endonuclease
MKRKEKEEVVMTVQEMKQLKQEYGYSYERLADLSGVPLGTVQKIFSGETKSPRYDTLLALENVFTGELQLRESCSAYNEPIPHTQGHYTVEDYRALPEDQRVELIDGKFYDMAAPTPIHQLIAGEVYRQIANYIMDRGGACRPFVSPIDVQLDCDEKTMVQPDVAILCHEDRLQNWGVYGAMDFVMEVISPSSRRKDYFLKAYKYENAGVREYWILDPYDQKLIVYFFESDLCPRIYGLDQPVPINIYDGKLSIDFTHIAKWIHELLESKQEE